MMKAKVIKYSSFLFMYDGKMKQGEQHTSFLYLLLSLLLPNNDREETGWKHSSYSSELNFILLHASDWLLNLYIA